MIPADTMREAQNDYHPTVEKIRSLLADNTAWFETFEHEPVRTSEEAAALRDGYAIAQGAKSIIVRVKEKGKGKRFVMLVVPGDKRFDTDKLQDLFGFSDIRFATEDEVAQITGGVLPGGVPPFGNLFGLDVYADESLLAQEKIIFNAGDRRFSIGMYARDFRNIASPTIAAII